jgi:outer membrane autotransporter protein
VTVAFTQLPFAGFAVTPNQAAVGAAAQKVPVLTAALNTLPLAGQFPAALNALSPQGYQVWSDFAFAHATSLADRLLRDAGSPSGRDEYYFEGGQRRGRARADLDVGASRYTSSQGLVGGNHAVTADTSVGAFFAFGKTTAGLGSAGSQTTVKDKTLGVRAAWSSGPLFAEAMVAYGFNKYESTRPILFSGTSAVATSATNGHQWTAGMTVGKHLTNGRLTVSPFAGLLASRWTGNRFAEEGAGDYNATVYRQSARSLRSQLGLEGRLTLGRLQPHVRAAWLHEFSNDSRGMNASFGGVDYTVVTRRAPRDSAIYSAGLDFVLGPRALLYTDVSAQTGGTTKVLNEWTAGLSINF